MSQLGQSPGSNTLEDPEGESCLGKALPTRTTPQLGDVLLTLRMLHYSPGVSPHPTPCLLGSLAFWLAPSQQNFTAFSCLDSSSNFKNSRARVRFSLSPSPATGAACQHIRESDMEPPVDGGLYKELCPAMRSC